MKNIRQKAIDSICRGEDFETFEFCNSEYTRAVLLHEWVEAHHDCIEVQNGDYYPFELIRHYMDDTIVENILNDFSNIYITNDELYSIYCEDHETKYGEIFEFAKSNPQI